MLKWRGMAARDGSGALLGVRGETSILEKWSRRVGYMMCEL